MSEQILDTTQIVISINQIPTKERDLMGEAIEKACELFQVDDNFNINAVDGAERSDCCIKVRFLYHEVVLSYTGMEYNYYFEASVVKEDE